ncbi:winged helix-turn-helix domain-containing protein [Microbacterium sp. ISL-103]|uniref:ArsR/SmtB family transcription factor n=1 Tax=Microbacterium sp. ISL-103 TaxID=2819156 RepID=UPI0020355595|nr:winged helix-turn-helix domain-containing protein [Microbacterium sp. ISL-103]
MEPDTASAIERRLTELEQEVVRLSTLADAAAHAADERAAAFDIESADAGADPDAASAGPGDPAAAGSDAPAATDDPLWFVNELGRRAPGAVMMAGAVDTAAGPVRWQYGLMADGLLSEDWSDLAHPLEALGHPARIELVRQVMRGAHTTAELLQLEHLASSGQLYHHLRQLVTAGWLVSPRRGYYEVPAARVVPLLVLTMIASS